VWLTLALREGKNREVRKIMEHLGLSVNRLIRMSFGPFALGDLEMGAVEEVKRRVLADQLGAEVAGRLGLQEKQQHRHKGTSSGSKGREQDRAPSRKTASAKPPAKAKPSAKSRKPKGRP
jgi:23S rRNA pseudouridine2605 synthase